MTSCPLCLYSGKVNIDAVGEVNGGFASGVASSRDPVQEERHRPVLL